MCVGTTRNYSSLLINKTQKARSKCTNAVHDAKQCSSPRGSMKYYAVLLLLHCSLAKMKNAALLVKQSSPL